MIDKLCFWTVSLRAAFWVATLSMNEFTAVLSACSFVTFEVTAL